MQAAVHMDHFAGGHRCKASLTRPPALKTRIDTRQRALTWPPVCWAAALIEDVAKPGEEENNKVRRRELLSFLQDDATPQPVAGRIGCASLSGRGGKVPTRMLAASASAMALTGMLIAASTRVNNAPPVAAKGRGPPTSRPGQRAATTAHFRIPCRCASPRLLRRATRFADVAGSRRCIGKSHRMSFRELSDAALGEARARAFPPRWRQSSHAPIPRPGSRGPRRRQSKHR